MSEHSLQLAMFEWAAYSTGRYPPLEMLHCIPNGQYRKGQRLEAGVKKGIPDTFLPYASQGYHGLYIELKWGKNKLSKHQKEVIAKLRKNGYRVEVCYTLEAIIKVIEDYLQDYDTTRFTN